MATIQEIFNSVYQAAATLLEIGGGAADDAAAAGNPVLTAGKYSAAPATRHDGDAVTQQMTATGAAHVAASGMAAHDAAAAGNPVQVGGVYRVADPVLADGDVGSLRVNAKGEALMQLTGSIASEYEALTIDNTVGGIALTAAKYGTSTKAYITCETAQIRFTIDGTAPTTTVGHLLEVGDILKLDSAADIAAFRAIRTGASSGAIKCTYSA